LYYFLIFTDLPGFRLLLGDFPVLQLVGGDVLNAQLGTLGNLVLPMKGSLEIA